MPPQMVACPSCGTPNSTNKRICYHCHGDMAKAVTRKVIPAPKPPVETSQPAFMRQNPQVNKAFEKPIVSNRNLIVFGASLRQRAQMYRQLHSLLHSGIPLGLALNYLEDNLSFQLKPYIRWMAEYVQRGGLLSEAMTAYPSLFPDWEIQVVVAAEKAGTLPEVMMDIADTIEMEYDLRTRIFTATFMIWATLIVFVLVILIVTSIQGSTGADDVWKRVGQAFIKFAAVIGIAIAIRALWRLAGRTPRGAAIIAQIIPRVPMLGPIWRDLARIRFANVLASLWHAGVPPMDALQTAARTTGNNNLQYQVAELSGRFGQGSLLSSIIATTKFLPQEALYMLQTGEATGDVAESLRKVAEYHEIELSAQVKTLPSRLMLVFYAIIVPLIGWFIISFWSNYYGKIMNQ